MNSHGLLDTVPTYESVRTTVDPGIVDGLKRLRPTSKLSDWLVDASHFFRRRARGSFSTAIVSRLISKISRR